MANHNDYLSLNDVLRIAADSHVPECTFGFDRPLTELDYLTYKQICECNLIKINNELERHVELLSNAKVMSLNDLDKDKLLSFTHLLILCGEHSELNYWSSIECVSAAAKISKNLVQLYGINMQELLLANNHCVFKNALNILRPKLLLTTWKCHPAAVVCYCWMLTQIKTPYMAEHINFVLPTALIILDDFETYNKIRGLKCINHIINNIAKGELEMYNRNEVILEGLGPIFYQNDLDVLEPFFLCCIALMKKMGHQLYSNYSCRNKFDDLFDAVLNNINMEERKPFKIIYFSYLPEMISAIRLRILMHSRKLFEIIARELDGESDDHMKCLSLKVLDSALKFYWPRQTQSSKQHRTVVLAILKLLLHLSIRNDEKTVRSDLVTCIRSSLQSIKIFRSNELDQFRNYMNGTEQFSEHFKTLVDIVLC